MIGKVKHWVSAVARSIFYDNSVSGLISTNAQDAIDELNTTAAVSASPGFTWGRSGNSTAGAYLQNDTVPSNVSGRIVPLSSGNITNVFIACDVTATFSIKIQKRSGASFVDLTTVTITAARTGTFTVTGVPVVLNDEIAVQVSSGSAQNVVVGIVIKGSL